MRQNTVKCLIQRAYIDQKESVDARMTRSL